MADRNGHPSIDIVSSHGTELDGKRIVLCVSGSVAAYKAIEIARLLMRHGADVTCVASDAARRLIRPDYLRWATGNRVVTKLTGQLEHVRLADYGRSDMILVYPATANTLGRLANGMDDTPVSTVLTVGMGAGIPILMCLAMHSAMYDNAAVKRNIEFLQGRVRFARPRMAEGKAKLPEPEDVLDMVLDTFDGSSPLKGKTILIAAGPTAEHIDPVRVITNLSSGRTGTLLASELASVGAKVTMVYGPGSHEPPEGIRVIRVVTGKEMGRAVMAQMRRKFDVIVMAAAVADYAPEKIHDSKMRSDKDVTIRLKRIPKIIDSVRARQQGALLVGFKAEHDVTRRRLVESARHKMAESGADFVVANDIGREYRKDTGRNLVLAVDGKRAVSSGRRDKAQIATFIRKQIESRVASRGGT